MDISEIIEHLNSLAKHVEQALLAEASFLRVTYVDNNDLTAIREAAEMLDDVRHMVKLMRMAGKEGSRS